LRTDWARKVEIYMYVKALSHNADLNFYRELGRPQEEKLFVRVSMFEKKNLSQIFSRISGPI
jgi:hypothetical protein